MFPARFRFNVGDTVTFHAYVVTGDAGRGRRLGRRTGSRFVAPRGRSVRRIGDADRARTRQMTALAPPSIGTMAPVT